MQYSPKLKIAMKEIEAILNKHDIGGMVIIHTPGNSEFLNKLNPSYSCIQFDGNMVRFRSKLADYGGDKAAWHRKTRDSLNLLQCLTEVGGNILMPLIELTEKLEKQLGDDSDDGEFTSTTTQNN